VLDAHASQAPHARRFRCGASSARIVPGVRASALAQSAPASLIVAPDGAVWFAEPLHSRIGRLTPDGALTETII
jgi:streptogramin lyase